MDATGTIYAVWVGPDTAIMYSSKPRGSPWTAPEALPGPHDNWGGSPKLAIDEQRTIHVLWSAGAPMSLYYSEKPAQGQWSTPETVPGTYSARVET